MLIIILLGLIMFTNSSQVAVAQEKGNTSLCATQKLEEVLQSATSEQPSVYIDCSLTIPKNAIISKQLVFAGEQASNIVFDGNGAEINATHAEPAILITSKLDSPHQKIWQVPHHITIKNVQIRGSLRIHGMAANGEGELLRQSSHQAGHSKRAQQAAPHHIVLDNLSLMAGQHNMMYFAPGVHQVTLKNSDFSGKTAGLALYLDAESSHNIIENNRFNVDTKSRELIAVDGSAHNIIRRNTFIDPPHGAIYLYRNCGEGGTVRHQTSGYNQIIQNQFELSVSSQLPLIWLASRNGHRNYCDADNGFAFGSSLNDKDLAQNNSVCHNTFNLKKIPKLIRWVMKTDDRLIKVSAQPNEVNCNRILD